LFINMKNRLWTTTDARRAGLLLGAQPRGRRFESYHTRWSFPFCTIFVSDKGALPISRVGATDAGTRLACAADESALR
jgi:hypothetical protein